MTTVYIPRLIETVADAEGLPDGTVITHPEHWPLEKFQGGWEGCDTRWGHPQVVGWTALVPVEAVEEWATDESLRRWSEDGVYSSPENVLRDGWTAPPVRRLVTPWQSVTLPSQ